MKKMAKPPRILKIVSVKDHQITCIFNNGEKRIIDLKDMLDKMRVRRSDPANTLRDRREVAKVRLRNNNLSWRNIPVRLKTFEGGESEHPFEFDPAILFLYSKPAQKGFRKFDLGKTIRDERRKLGLTQDELAARSGTSKSYISRLENDAVDPELHTLHKIVEIGMGKKLKVLIA